MTHTVATVQNLTSTLNLVGALTRDHVVLFASSADVYGAHSHLYDRPMREDDCFRVRARPGEPVGLSPREGARGEPDRQQSGAFGDPSGLQHLWPGMDFPAPKRVIPHFVASVLGAASPASERRWTPAPDLLSCRGHGARLRAGARLRLRSSARRGAECFNLGGDEPIAIRDLAQRVIEPALELGPAPGAAPDRGERLSLQPGLRRYLEPGSRHLPRAGSGSASGPASCSIRGCAGRSGTTPAAGIR